MSYRGQDQEKKNTGPPLSRPVWVLSFFFAALIILGFVLGLLFPDNFKRVSFAFTRIKNTVSFVVLGKAPQFYFLDMEKNGKDVRLTKNDALDVTYRDEFVIKDISSDAFWGRGMAVDVEGIGGQNDFRILLKGVDLVDRIVAESAGQSGAALLPGSKIRVLYGGLTIASIPVKVTVAPQDWLRYAKNSNNRRVQIEYLQKAVAMNPGASNLRAILGGLYMRAGMTREAISQYREVLRTKPDDVNTLAELSKAYMNTREYEKVVKISQRLLAVKSSDSGAYLNMAAAYAYLGDGERAIENYRRSLKLDPDNPLILVRLGEAYEKAGKRDLALEQFKTALSKAPATDHVLDAVAGAYAGAGKYDDAIKLYREILRKEPRNAAIYAKIGLTMGKKGLLKEAEENYRKSLTLNPGDAVVHFNLATIYEKEKRDQDAVKEYRRVLEIKPDDVDALWRLADISMKGKQYVQALKYYETILRLSRQKAPVYAGIGLVYGALKKYSEAAVNYEKALRMGVSDPQVHYNLALTYDKLEKKNKAISEYEQYVSQKPTVEVLNILASHYLKIKQYDRAIKAYKKMIDIAPGKASVYAGLAYVYNLKGDTDREIEYYRTSLRYDSEDDNVHMYLAAAYEKKGMFSEAYKEYVRAYELNPELTKAAAKIPQMRIKMIQKKIQSQG